MGYTHGMWPRSRGSYANPLRQQLRLIHEWPGGRPVTPRTVAQLVVGSTILNEIGQGPLVHSYLLGENGGIRIIGRGYYW